MLGQQEDCFRQCSALEDGDNRGSVREMRVCIEHWSEVNQIWLSGETDKLKQHEDASCPVVLCLQTVCISQVYLLVQHSQSSGERKRPTLHPLRSRTICVQPDKYWHSFEGVWGMGGLLRDRVEHVWAFPSATMPSWAETETEAKVHLDVWQCKSYLSLHVYPTSTQQQYLSCLTSEYVCTDWYTSSAFPAYLWGLLLLWHFCISRVPDQNGVSLLYIMLEVHHSGREPLICDRFFFNPTIEVVTFRLRGLCLLGVLLFPTFTRLGHGCQDLLSPCDGMHMCID